MGFSECSIPALPPHFLQIVVEVNALGPTHVIDLWLGGRERYAHC